jgi:hypothetical protein
MCGAQAMASVPELFANHVLEFAPELPGHVKVSQIAGLK